VSIDQRKLMQYFDGELDHEQAAEVEALLENDVEAQRVLEGIDQVGAVVRGVMLDQARPPSDLSDVVMARIAAEPRTAEPRGPRAWRKLRDEPRLRHAVPLALGALAAAAALALVFERQNPPLPRVSPTASPQNTALPQPAPTPSASEQPELELASAESTPAIAIETVDFGGREGTIFMLAEGEIATPVVWLMDEPGTGRDSMEPL
jgi:anti-sigma factor RsiW